MPPAPASPWRCTPSATWPIARRSTPSSARDGSGSHAVCGSASSTPSCWRPRRSRRFAQVGVAASVQFSHAPSDRDLADAEWGDAARGAYAYRSLAEAGALLANGSDAPVEELDPLAGIRAGVLRTLDSRPPWRPEQSLTGGGCAAGLDHRAGLALGR